MPSLILFGRRTFFAGDDLRPVAMTCFIYRFTQLSLIVPFFSIIVKRHDLEFYRWAQAYCFDDGNTNWFVENSLAVSYIYALFGLCLAIAGLIGSARLYVVSGRGTPTNTKPRDPLYPLSYLHLTVFNALRILTGILAILSISTIDVYCDCVTTRFDDDDETIYINSDGEGRGSRPIKTARNMCFSDSRLIGVFVAIVISHAIDMFYSFATILYFFCKMFPNIGRRILSPETECIVCCRCCVGVLSCLTCCLYGGSEAIRGGDLSDFAFKITNYFDAGGILDIALSDIMAGLSMVKREHLQAQIKRSRERLLKATHEAAMAPEELQGNQNETTARPSFQRAASMTVVDYMKSLRHLTKTHIETGMEALAQAWTPGQSLAFHSTQEARDSRKTFVPKIRETLSSENPYEKYLIAEGARFICISEAIYTWSTWRQHSSLLGRCCCSGVLIKDDTLLDDLMSSGGHSILAMAPVFGLKDEDIVYAQCLEGLGKTPYAIVLDHAWKSVVVAIRGSVSLEDMLSDISGRPYDLTEVGEQHGFDGKGRFCHAGILECAKWVYEDLQRYVQYT
jgi:sn1-specific diacylglycerol lipase